MSCFSQRKIEGKRTCVNGMKIKSLGIGLEILPEGENEIRALKRRILILILSGWSVLRNAQVSTESFCDKVSEAL